MRYMKLLSLGDLSNYKGVILPKSDQARDLIRLLRDKDRQRPDPTA